MYTIKYQYWNCTIHYNYHFDTVIMSLICQKRIAVSMVVTENIVSVWLSIRLTPAFSTPALSVAPGETFDSQYTNSFKFAPPSDLTDAEM